MKGVIRGIIAICCGLIVYKAYVGFYGALATFPIVTNYEIDWDVRFSEKAKKEIFLFIKKNSFFKTFDFENQKNVLKEQFRCVHDYTCYRHPNGTCFLSLSAADVLILVNDKHVAMHNGTCLESSWFDSAFLATLPELIVKNHGQDTEKLDPCCKEFINAMPWHEIRGYLVEWYGPTKHRLVHKKQPLFSLMCNNEQIPSATLMYACDSIMQELEAKGSFKRNKEWVADARFKGQIVVYAQGKRG
jgi:hypothetical protein